MPWEGAEHIQNNDEAPLFYNPAVVYTLSKLLKDDRVVIKIEGDTWKVWYPLTQKVQVEEVNETLNYFDIEMKEYTIDRDNVFGDMDQMSDITVTTIASMVPSLRNRLGLENPRPVEYAIVLDDDLNVMKHIYEAMYVGQLMVTGEEKFNFYRGYAFEQPSEEELPGLKLIIFPGSV